MENKTLSDLNIQRYFDKLVYSYPSSNEKGGYYVDFVFPDKVVERY